MAYRLTSTDASYSFELRDHASLIVGRAPASDIPVIDPTISRRHAEIALDEGGHAIVVRDLGSSNGTFVNGTRVESAPLAPGDIVAFGKVSFRIQETEPHGATNGAAAEPQPGATIVRPISVSDTSSHRLAAVDKNRQKLATLLEVSKGLGKAADIDSLLDKIVEYAYQVLEDDRGELIPKIARDRRGDDATRTVPRSIARTALKDKVAILTDNAGEDSRFGGNSIVMQRVRSAICVPLIGSEDRALGVLYVDHVTSSSQFSEDDFEFCIAFAGIAAVAIENGQFAQRIQRELLTRSNFERFFAPQLAKRIAESSETLKLGGEKRPIAVLFSDIRGFTALAESMRPDDMASLLTEYFTAMVECVFRHDGTLDKFMGDSIMAEWGAPIGGDSDADHAMAAAVDMMRELDELNVSWRAAGKPELHIGIGLNYGEAFAGTIGSERRLEFTVIGDTVNTAHRLCSAAEAGEILITDDFRRALREPPALVECPPMVLKNKANPVSVYRVVPG